MKTMTNYYIFQMAIADCGLGLMLPFHIATYFLKDVLRDPYVCTLRFVSLLMMSSASVLLTTSLTLDRYIAIFRPLLYDNEMTRARVTLVTTLTWLLAFVVSFLIPMFWHNPEYGACTGCIFTRLVNIKYFRYMMIPAAFGALLIQVVLYLRIFVVAIQQQTRISEEWRDDNNHLNRSMRKQLKVVKTAFFICLSAFGLWVPYFIVLAIQVFYPGMLYNDRIKMIRGIATLMALANAALNPVIYTLRMAPFRREIRELLHLQNNKVEHFTLE
ncbi:hypothetical protein LSH36_76g01003 [Paralvinella palmiformis]|uniref:G-protein coupled receptors family 1 profile domain-containing protein n=1 Tax=Paralvinella palmiformis TaxID=53620 RepID=A0AAD9NCX5_9ANNE|nr:hypothetical protein LSH36_76g01003 [Paralvinella palmiformis]